MFTPPLKALRFDDFHVYGASAPEWNQRYQQISRGTMRSSMTEVVVGSVHLFRKALDQRVVQQGCLPAGKLCVVMLDSATGPARLQGREVNDSSISVLRGGDEFMLHRPAQTELLALTVDAAQFDRLVAEQLDAPMLRGLLRRSCIDVGRSDLAEFKALLSAMFVWGQGSTVYALPPRRDLDMQALIHDGLLAVLRGAGREGKRVKGLSAHGIVRECHRITMDSAASPPPIEELCRRLRTSRRSLQDSFQTIAGTTPVDYLRCMRLNLVRQTLHRTTVRQASIGDIATRAGFAQLSHFAAEYKRLFAELPSQTLRADRLHPGAFTTTVDRRSSSS